MATHVNVYNMSVNPLPWVMLLMLHGQLVVLCDGPGDTAMWELLEAAEVLAHGIPDLSLPQQASAADQTSPPQVPGCLLFCSSMLISISAESLGEVCHSELRLLEAVAVHSTHSSDHCFGRSTWRVSS